MCTDSVSPSSWRSRCSPPAWMTADRGWLGVDMARDFARVFPFEETGAGEGGR